MLMADTTVRPWTRAELTRLPDDGNRYEVLDGELFVTPAPTWRHQRIAVELTTALRLYCRDQRMGLVAAPGALRWSSNELQPDVMVIPGPMQQLRDEDWANLPLPILAVEIESDSSRQRDRGVKRTAYVEALGIATYWLVDPVAETIRVITSGTDERLLNLGDTLEWVPVPSAQPFKITLQELFRPTS